MNEVTSDTHLHTDRSVSTPDGALRRTGLLAYGVGAYAVGVSALVALILVMLGVLDFTGGPVQLESPLLAVAFDLALLVAFGLQHSVMARAGFKERWTRVIHPSMERSTYVLATGLVLLPVLAIGILSIRPGGLRQQLRQVRRRFKIAMVLAGVYLAASTVVHIVIPGSAVGDDGLIALAVVEALVFVVLAQDPDPARR